jgi:type VI secretion system secreted protein VgrG
MPSAVKNNVADIYWEGPGGKMAVTEFTAEDQLSHLSRVEVLLVASEPITDFSSFLGSEAKIAVMVGEELLEKRYFSGIITRIHQAGTVHGDYDQSTDKGFIYEVHLVPKMWLLTKVQRSKVYQKQTVREIVNTVMSERGIRRKWQVQANLKPNEYCVQYKETDFNFVSRLLEYEGIYYYYDHEQATVVFCDHPGAHQPCKPFDKAYYAEGEMHYLNNKGYGFIRRLYYGEAVGTGKFEAHDYNYETSTNRLSGKYSSTAKTADKSLESYVHNVGHDKHTLDLSTTQARLQGEAEAASLRILEGEANSRHLTCGFIFNLEEHYIGSLNQAYLLTGTRVHMEQGRYVAQFTAMPADAPYRPQRMTPVPRVDGIQTATVTGPSGSKVFLDKMGRAKLQFHWDREGGKNDSSSMWVRVSNGYGGKDYGIQWIPRVGHEVLVQFLDGDPDRPVIIGRVYNDANTAPLGPDQKWQNIIKTIKDNHILFDDKDGEEFFEIRAEKDMNTLVVHDQTKEVGNNVTVEIGNNTSTTIGNDEYIEIGNDQKHKIEGSTKTEIKGSKEVEVKKNYEIESKQGKIEIEADKGGIKLESGGSKVEIKPTGITLKFGGSTVKLDSMGVTIKGILVKIN